MEELKQCPFCGGEGEIKHGEVYMRPMALVQCKECHNRTKFFLEGEPVSRTHDWTKDDTEREAAKAWNKRVV